MKAKVSINGDADFAAEGFGVTRLVAAPDMEAVAALVDLIGNNAGIVTFEALDGQGYDQDVLLILRPDSPAERTAARAVRTRCQQAHVHSFRCVELPGWKPAQPLSEYIGRITVESLRSKWAAIENGPEANLSEPKPGTNGKPTDAPLNYGSLSDEELGITEARNVQEAPIEWEWEYRMALAEMTMIAGEGGLGKGLLLLWLASIITRNGLFPGGVRPARVGRVLILSAEDRPETTLKPRLTALGADLDLISFHKARVTIKRPDKPPLVHPVSFQDLRYWQEVLNRRPDTVMFAVDGLPPYLGRGVNDSKNNEVRAVLEPFLDEVIRPRNIAMTAVSHLSKAVDARTPQNRILGSVAYSKAARQIRLLVCYFGRMV